MKIMSKYFGHESREAFIRSIEESEMWIYYKDSEYVFTLDGRGWNCIGQIIDGRDIYEDGDAQDEYTVSGDTIEEMIAKVVFTDGVTLNEALEMDLPRYNP